MSISFIRIDDRVLHGQTVTRWLGTKPCKGILIVDNNIANDPFQVKIFKNAAPTGIKVGIYDEKEGANRIAKAMQVENGYFLICKTPRTLVNLMRAGVDFGKTVNVGPMSARANTITVSRNCSLTEDEVEAFAELDAAGIEIQFQLIPDNSAAAWKSIKAKIESKKG